MDNEIQDFFVRVFVEPKDISEAENIAFDLCKKFEKYGIAKIESIKPYWKIETYFELLFVVDKCVDKTAFQHIMAEIGKGWNITNLADNEQEAILDGRENEVTYIPIKWAHVGIRLIPPIDFGTKIIIMSNEPETSHLQGEEATVEGVARRTDGGWNYSVWVESEQQMWCFDQEELVVQ